MANFHLGWHTKNLGLVGAFLGGQIKWKISNKISQLDDGWPESEKDVFQAALSMVVVKNSRWMVGEFYMSYGGVSCEK